MLTPDPSEISSVNPSISYQTTNSAKTNNADLDDKNNIEALQKEENKDSNIENRTEEAKEITPSELSDLTSKESSENNDQLSHKSSYKKGPTISLFSKMTDEQNEQKLLEII